MDPKPKKACKCGTTRDDEWAVAEREYSTMGSFYLLWGGTAVPTKVSFRCMKCQRVFDEAVSQAELRRYVV